MIVVLVQTHVVIAAELVYFLIYRRAEGDRGFQHRNVALIYAFVGGVILLRKVFFEAVDAVIAAVEVQNAVFAVLGRHIVAHLKAQLLKQLVSDNCQRVILSRADGEGAELGDVGTEYVIIQHIVAVAAAEADAHTLFRIFKACPALHLQAAVDVERAAVLKI